jgi:hypothetical protein
MDLSTDIPKLPTPVAYVAQRLATSSQLGGSQAQEIFSDFLVAHPQRQSGTANTAPHTSR